MGLDTSSADLRLDYAKELDRADELACLRKQFYLPSDTIYLDGNSLGPLSKPAERAVLQLIDQWRTHAVDGWNGANPPWFTPGA